jgi:heme/copper-type cytochrome/quinol oxidase subunit 2
MDAGTREFYIVMALMVVLFIFAIGAVIIFIRQWRREHK